MNHVVLSGFVGKDPEIRKRDNYSIAKFSIATSMFRNKKKETDWHDVEAFGQNADYIEGNVKKGDFVVISGYLTTTSYIDKNNNERKNYGVKIITIESNNKGREAEPKPTPRYQPPHVDDDIPY